MAIKKNKFSLFKVQPKSQAAVNSVVDALPKEETPKAKQKAAAKAVAKATAEPDLDGGPKSGKVVSGVFALIFGGPQTLFINHPFTLTDAAPAPLPINPGPLTLASNNLDPSDESTGALK